MTTKNSKFIQQEIEQENKYDWLNKIASDRNFLALDSALRNFNIFRASDMGNQEIKHTKFLAYLLDPHQPHGLGFDFLRSILISFSATENSAIPILDLDFECTSVKTEESFPAEIEENGKSENILCTIDILIEIKSRTNPEKSHIIAIENKIRSTQSPNQLRNYSIGINKKFSTKAVGYHFFYLTHQEKEENIPANWIRTLYSTSIEPVLSSIRKTHKETMSVYLDMILQDYSDLISSTEDEHIERLALSISPVFINNLKSLHKKISSESHTSSLEWLFCQKYSQGLKYISKFNVSRKYKVLREFNKLNLKDIEIEKSGSTYLRFSIKSIKNEFGDRLSEMVPSTELNDSAFEMQLRLDEQENGEIKISPSITVRPLKDDINRDHFVRILWKHLIADEYSREIKAYWTRVYSKTPTIINPDNDIYKIKDIIEEIRDEVTSKLKDALTAYFNTPSDFEDVSNSNP